MAYGHETLYALDGLRRGVEQGATISEAGMIRFKALSVNRHPHKKGCSYRRVSKGDATPARVHN